MEMMEISQMTENLSGKEENDVVWQNLPLLVLENVFKYLSLEDICRAGGVCRSWHDATRHSLRWKKVVKMVKQGTFMKFLAYLPSTVRDLHVLHDFTEDYSELEKHSVLLPDIINVLAQNCPSLRSLIIENVHVKTRINCRRQRTGKEEKEWDDIFANINPENCCEFNYCGRYEISLPPTLECLSLRRVFTQFDNFSRKIKSLNLKVLDWVMSEKTFHDNEFLSSSQVQGFCNFRNLEEFYSNDFEYELSTYTMTKVIRSARNLRVLCCSPRVEGCKVFCALRKYKPPLEELCLAKSIAYYQDVTGNSNTLLPKLRLLCLRGACINIYKLIKIINFCPQLERIDVRSTGITDNDITSHISAELRGKIVSDNKSREWTLSSCRLCDHFMENGHYDKYFS